MKLLIKRETSISKLPTSCAVFVYSSWGQLGLHLLLLSVYLNVQHFLATLHIKPMPRISSDISFKVFEKNEKCLLDLMGETHERITQFLLFL